MVKLGCFFSLIGKLCSIKWFGTHFEKCISFELLKILLINVFSFIIHEKPIQTQFYKIRGLDYLVQFANTIVKIHNHVEKMKNLTKTPKPSIDQIDGKRTPHIYVPSFKP